jgi:hypothetical protein
MGEVVEFEDKKDRMPSFTISCRLDEEQSWHVTVDKFYDDRMEEHAAYREIAEALLVVMGGMIHSAEEMEPTARGSIVSNIALYKNGHIDFHSEPINTKERKAWFLEALKIIKKTVQKA